MDGGSAKTGALDCCYTHACPRNVRQCSAHAYAACDGPAHQCHFSAIFEDRRPHHRARESQMKSFPDSVQTGIEFSAELFRKSKRAVVLTGAGISTPSGIPDFRSEGSGLWSRDEPLEVASLLTFRTHPEKSYAWFRPLVRQIFEAIPNAAHRALAELEKAGYLHSVLTQNIDMLHEKAGSMHVV